MSFPGPSTVRRLVRRLDLGPGISRPLRVTAVAVGVGMVISLVDPPSDPARIAVTGLHAVAGAGLLVVVLRLLEQVRDTPAAGGTPGAAPPGIRRAPTTPIAPIAPAAADLREAQSTLHEVRATVAGLAHATHLLTDSRGLSPETRDRLLAASATEIARMHRLLASDTVRDAADDDTDGDVAAALRHLVEGLRSGGHRVDLTSCTEVRHPAADEVVRITHALLENAARHGLDPIVVALEVEGAQLHVSVTDAGPGVPGDLGDRIFDWGVSGAGSSGIGLPDARARARALGGRLHLEHRPGCTRFEIVLPLGAEAVA